MRDLLLPCKKKSIHALVRFVLHFDHVIIAFITIVMMQLVVHLALNVESLNPAARTIDNFRLTDVFYEISNTEEKRDTSDLITIVDMTNVYDRSRLAEIIDQVQAYEPSVMGVDIVFDGFRNDSVGNARLLETVCNTTSTVVWAYKLIDWNSDEGHFERSYHSFFTELVDVDNEGFINVQRDTNGGTVRKLGLHRTTNNGTEYSMSAQVALAATNDSSIINRFKDFNICYTSKHFPVVPADSIAENADLIHSRIVLLGAMHDYRDKHYTPIGKMPGVNILAYAIQTLVQRKIMMSIPYWMIVIITFLLIWFTQILQDGATRFLKRADEATIRHFIGDSGFASSMISLSAIILIIWGAFILFLKFNIYIDSMWSIMGIALLANIRKFYALIVRLLCAHTNWSLLQYSLYSYKTKTHNSVQA